MKINNEVQFEDLKSSDQVLIQMQNITKIFKTGAGDFTALDDVSLDFFKGEFVGIVGRSGSGKSTLANMITGIDHPTSGNIVIDNQVTNKKNENDMSIWRGRNLGIVFQFFQLLPTLTLLENVMLPMDFCNHNQASEREYQAVELLKLVGLENYVNKLPDMVSGGQQQSAAIARALANDPPILIADEPTGNLDAKTAESVFDLFSVLVEKGKTIIMVTHDPNLANRTERVVRLQDGRVVEV